MVGFKLIKDVQEVKIYMDGSQSTQSKTRKKEQLYAKKCLKNQLYQLLTKIKLRFSILIISTDFMLTEKIQPTTWLKNGMEKLEIP